LHSEERAISLSLKMCPPNPRLARNPFQVRNSVRPMHLFGHNVDHDYYFELLREEEPDSLQAKLLLLLLATSARLEAQEARVVDLLNVNQRTEPPSYDFHQFRPTA